MREKYQLPRENKVKILGVDTSLDRLNIGLIEDRIILAETAREAKGILAEIIIDSIDRTLREAKTSLSELSGLAISIGPGSFTGLRVGLSVLKGMAWSSNLPLLAIPTFEALVYQSGEKERPVAVVIQGKQGVILAGVYEFKKTLPILKGEFFTSQLHHLPEKIPPQALLIVLGGNLEVAQLKKSLPGREILINNEAGVLRGSSVAFLGLEKLKQGQAVDPKNVEPIYLQKAIYRSPIKYERVHYPHNDRG
ncbi:MAG: tRNA (adenosine(37)-N6)-threonylcarbamoyltransferase complex dimerization subunit type 1 TsaB [candidate division Zixibacteria bacterium RBG_16_48_11]|nr:MAG: tRNA (adenosine(37)-N6)-threonylcarbamoyltransferase complex dimerization subunit type 1 TsaB [candidate division Zixibacteria bacterium RBG_16_48_11]